MINCNLLLIKAAFTQSPQQQENKAASKIAKYSKSFTSPQQKIAKVSKYFSQSPQLQENTIIKHVEYPYFVSRTKYKELPVYIDIKNGGTRVLTEISRIEGDSEALRNDILRELFGFSQEKNLVSVKPTNNHVVIKGRHGYMVKEWLARKGF